MAVLVLGVAWMLALASCVRRPARPSADHSISDTDLPATVAAHVGETIEVDLASNASTGYSWRCAWTPKAALTQVGEGSQGGDSIKPGSGGTTIFTFKAAQPGRAVITLQYGRWWKGGDREKPQTVTVNVNP